jgi:hypothetical protein
MGILQDVKEKLAAAEAELASLTAATPVAAPTTTVASDVRGGVGPSVLETTLEAARLAKAQEAAVVHGTPAQNS